MRGTFWFQYPKTAALTVAAGFYIPFAADWCEPNLGLQQAAMALGALPGVSHPWFWNKLVGIIGRDVSWLGAVSMVSAFVCVLLIAVLSGFLAEAALRTMRRRVSLSDGDADGLRGRIEFLTSLAFILTPGFFHAATHVGPLHALLIPLLAGLVSLVYLVRLLTAGEEPLADRMKRGIAPMFLSLAFSFYAVCEMALSRHFLQSETPAFVVFAAIGILPLAVLLHLVRRRLLLTQRAFNRFFACWAFLIAGFGALSLLAAGRGRVASRVVQHILDDARTCQAVVSEGTLDLMFSFMLPENQRLILLSRDGDRDYGRDLAAWIRKHYANRIDLLVAAELGPRALVEEWTAGDRAESSSDLLTQDGYFPTLEKWRKGFAEVAGMDAREPYGVDLLALFGSCGNRLGRRLLARGGTAEAWETFWEVVNLVDNRNYESLTNLVGILERGYVASPNERSRLTLLCKGLECEPAVSKRQLPLSRAVRSHEELPPRVQEFVRMVSAAPATRNDALRSRDLIRGGLASGSVRMSQVGTQLLTLDCWLDDWTSAEKDAIEILRQEREHTKANFVMGTAAESRGDHAVAEYCFRRALTSAPDDVCCREALARVLIRRRKATEDIKESGR